MATKFPKRRTNTWIPFIRNQTVITALAALLLAEGFHNIFIEILLGGGLLLANSIPIHHHIATEWCAILLKKNRNALKNSVLGSAVSGLFSKKSDSKAGMVKNVVPDGSFALGRMGEARIVRISRERSAVFFSDQGYQNRLCYLGVWLVPATSHLLLSSESEQQATFNQWGRTLANLAGLSVKRIQFFTDVIVTTAAGPRTPSQN